MKKIIFLVCLIFSSGCGSNHIEKKNLPAWQTQLSEGRTSFRGLCAVSEKIVWASGTDGSFARSIDGGQNWQVSKIAGAEKIDFRDIAAFDENTAIVFGIESPAKFFKTTDGGKNWRLVYDNNTLGLFFSAAAFWDSKNGIALSDPVKGRFFIVITRDGGENWKEVKNSPQAIKGEGIFAASGSNITLPGKNKIMFVTGCTASRVFTSTDKGAHWSFVNTPLESGTGSNGIFSIAMKNQKQGIIVGGDYKRENYTNSNTAVTTDGGKTWKLIEKNKPSGFRECVVFKDNSNTAITVGPNGSDVSFDDGNTWCNFSGRDGFHAAAFSPDGKSCWAAGGRGKIAKLTLTSQ